MSYGLGIDLGMSTTGSAAAETGRAPRMIRLGRHTALVPSVLDLRPDGSLALRSDPRSAPADPALSARDFKRRLGDSTPMIIGTHAYSAVALLAAALRDVVRRSELLRGGPAERVVLAHPAVWGPYRREQFEEVPRRAGLAEPPLLVAEPQAAAADFAARGSISPGDVVAVYDLGGSTFDAAVVEMTATGPRIVGEPQGLEWVGGVDFNEAVFAFVDGRMEGALSDLDLRDPEQALTLHRLRRDCVRVKEQLTFRPRANLTVAVDGEQVRVTVLREELEALIRPAVESTITTLQHTIVASGRPASSLTGVLLVGGSSQIPLVRRLLAETGMPLLRAPSPQGSVALGAAALAADPAALAGPDPLVRPVAAVVAPVAHLVPVGALTEPEPAAQTLGAGGHGRAFYGKVALAALTVAAGLVVVLPGHHTGRDMPEGTTTVAEAQAPISAPMVALPELKPQFSAIVAEDDDKKAKASNKGRGSSSSGSGSSGSSGSSGTSSGSGSGGATAAHPYGPWGGWGAGGPPGHGPFVPGGGPTTWP